MKFVKWHDQRVKGTVGRHFKNSANRIPRVQRVKACMVQSGTCQKSAVTCPIAPLIPNSSSLYRISRRVTVFGELCTRVSQETSTTNTNRSFIVENSTDHGHVAKTQWRGIDTDWSAKGTFLSRLFLTRGSKTIEDERNGDGMNLAV